jgi:hypothetical protein
MEGSAMMFQARKQSTQEELRKRKAEAMAVVKENVQTKLFQNTNATLYLELGALSKKI